MNSKDSLFRTEAGLAFKGISLKDRSALFEALEKELGVIPVQYCEAASYSFAMMVRVALGLSAEGARVAALVDDCQSGWVALATMRHLINAGTNCHILIHEQAESYSDNFAHQIHPLKAMGASIYAFSDYNELKEHIAVITDSHNVLCGLYRSDRAVDSAKDLVDLLNEIQTPVHCLTAPLGVDVDTGARVGPPLFASSTLSLGTPLKGLYSGADYVGRHYVCDVSLSTELYKRYGADLSKLFSEQPIVQIFPVKEDVGNS